MSSSVIAIANPDEAARRLAISPDRSLLVQAPAGSGKTELLIQRFLSLLAEVETPESIVAITFTRKAAGEMRERVLRALRRAEDADQPSSAHERISHELAIRALMHDRRLGWNLLEHPARLRVQTIDALCSSITRQMPWMARMGAHPSVTDNAGPLYFEAAHRTLAEIERDTARRETLESVLAHLDNNVKRASELIVSMLRKREQWLPLVAGEEIRRDALECGLRNAICDGLASVTRQIPPELCPELINLACFAASNLEDSDHPLIHCNGLTELPGTSIEEFPKWLGIARMLLKEDGDWRNSVNKATGFPPPASVGNPVLSMRYRERKAQYTKLMESVRANEELRAAMNVIRFLPPPAYTDQQWRVMNDLFRVLIIAAAQLKVVFRERGQVDFAEVSEAARHALGVSEAPSELALGLDSRLRHLLVDEFQDTSVAQFDLLRKLTAGWGPGDGKTLFLVGDPMQSIYRFRQAEVGLFVGAADDGVGTVELEFTRLRANYRSVTGIVEWVNRTFTALFPETSNPGTGAISYSASIATRSKRDSPAVSIHAFRKGEDQAEAERVVQIVQESRERNRGETVAILVRARNHLAVIVGALKRAGLKFQAIDIDALSQRSAVLDLQALTRAMLHLADRTAWLAILRAPWCGLDLADLHALTSHRPASTVWELLQGDLLHLSQEGRRRASILRATLSQALESRGRWSLRRWVERTWIALNGPACLPSENDLLDAGDYLDLLEKRESAGDLADFDGFHREVEQLFAQPDTSSDGTLQLMTIHRSKGLQFDSVILPGLGRLPRSDIGDLLLSAERPRHDGTVDRLIAPIRESGKQPDPVYSYIQELDKQKSAFETLRLLYVAATRARSQLHVMGHAVKNAKGIIDPAAGSLLDRLWPGLQEEERETFIDCYADGAEEVPLARLEGVPLKRLRASWVPPSLPCPSPSETEAEPSQARRSYSWVGSQLRHIGTVVHASLERIASEGLSQFDERRILGERDRVRLALANLGVVPADLDDAITRVNRALIATLASPKGRWILAARPGARSEYAIAGFLGGEVVRGAIDRTFIDEDGVRWIIDFKSSTHQGGDLEFFLDEEKRRYREQMERYARLLQPLGNPVKVGLYFPLLDAWREWTPGDAQS